MLNSLASDGITARLSLIRDGLAELRQKDVGLEVFGASSHKYLQSQPMPLPYSMRVSPAMRVGVWMPLLFGIIMDCPLALQHQWLFSALTSPLLIFFIFESRLRSSQRIVLGESGIHFSGLGKPEREVAWEEIEGLDIATGGGGNTTYLVVRRFADDFVRVYFEPFSHSEWAKFIEILVSKSPHAYITPKAKKLLNRRVYGKISKPH